MKFSRFSPTALYLIEKSPKENGSINQDRHDMLLTTLSLA